MGKSKLIHHITVSVWLAGEMADRGNISYYEFGPRNAREYLGDYRIAHSSCVNSERLQPDPAHFGPLYRWTNDFGPTMFENRIKAHSDKYFLLTREGGKQIEKARWKHVFSDSMSIS
jgi:hypothetical protein